MDFTNRSADAGECSHACEGADQGDKPHGLRQTAQWVSGFLWLCDRRGDLETLVPMGVESVQSVENGDRAGSSKGAAPDTTAASAGGVGGAGGHWLDFVDESCRKKTREIWQRCERAHIPFEGLLQLHRENAPPRCYFTRMLPYSLSSQARSEWGWIGVALDAERLGHGVRSWDKSVERIGLLELAAKATQDVLWDWNLRTQQLWWGENFYSRFGYSREETEADADPSRGSRTGGMRNSEVH